MAPSAPGKESLTEANEANGGESLRATSLAPKSIQTPSLPSLSPVKSSGLGGIKIYLASPSRNDPPLPEISEDLQKKHRFCLDIFVETKPAGF